MISKKLLGLVTSAFLLFNVVGATSVKTAKVNDVNAANNQQSSVAYKSYTSGGSFDLAIANEDKIVEMLKREGKIANDATPAEIQKIYQKYLQDAAAAQSQMTSGDPKLDKAYQAITSKKVADHNSSFVAKKNGAQSSTGIKPVQEQTFTGTERKDRVLVLLIDYPDLPHNSINPAKDAPVLYYKDFNQQHYQDMIFGDNGYTGPNGEKLMSMKQYYEQQSGGSYTIEGEVVGWYTASHNAAYYGAHTASGGNDANPRALIKEALNAAAKDPEIAKLGGLSYFDQEDKFDMNDNGNLREPDGIIDHIITIHAGIGEEAGGGSLGENAIWSHSWDLGGLYPIPGSTTTVPYWKGSMVAYDYTVEPEDGAMGVFAHEYGHDLGLPDEYDTIYSGPGEPIGFWSIMSSGSWGGVIAETEPTGFSPYAKQFLQATMTGSNWQPNVTTINYSDLTTTGKTLLLDQASSHGLNNNVIKVNLPGKIVKYTTPFGKYAYYSGKGSPADGDYETSMTTTVDLTGKTTAKLNFKTWYDIEEGYDTATVEVKDAAGNWVAIPGNITKATKNAYDVVNYIDGTSDGWVDAEFDLSAFKGQKIDLRFHYKTDSGVYQNGFFVDNMTVTADGSVILSDDAEGTNSIFDLKGGFKKSDGSSEPYTNYYLIEWRNQQGVDKSLAHVNRQGVMLSYDPGMVVWYVDESFTDNWTGVHPGDGYLGIVDADQNAMLWDYIGKNPAVASNSYQIHDAAFSLRVQAPFKIDQSATSLKRVLEEKNTFMHPFFDDSRNYTNPAAPFVGRNIPKLGIKVYVTGETSDRSSASILIKK